MEISVNAKRHNSVQLREVIFQATLSNALRMRKSFGNASAKKMDMSALLQSLLRSQNTDLIFILGTQAFSLAAILFRHLLKASSFLTIPAQNFYIEPAEMAGIELFSIINAMIKGQLQSWSNFNLAKDLADLTKLLGQLMSKHWFIRIGMRTFSIFKQKLSLEPLRGMSSKARNMDLVLAPPITLLYV